MPHVGVTDYLGPYNTFVLSFDSLISSFVYMQLLARNHHSRQQMTNANQYFVTVAVANTLTSGVSGGVSE